MFRKLAVCLTFCLATLCSIADAEPCRIVFTNSQEAIKFLKGTRSDSSANEDCILIAIESLYKNRSSEAINRLISYLDFKRPHLEQELVASTSRSDVYPAVTELFSIGQPALQPLTGVVSRQDSSPVSRENALKAIMMIHRDNPSSGVKFLMDEAARANDPTKADLLLRGASDATRWCESKERNSMLQRR